jgi:outer membrane protein assembly factor BamB
MASRLRFGVPGTFRGVVCAALVAAAVISVSAADHWPQFRGIDAGVVADDPSLPDRWSETENVVWKTSIHGLSWSSPIVWGDRIFITSAISSGKEPQPITGLYDPGDDQGSLRSTSEHRWMVYAIDFRTGKIVWERELLRAPPPIPRHIKNSFASETPVTDGERVYVYFGTIGIAAALDMQGSVAWKRELGAFSGSSGFGSGGSPALHGDRLYIVNDNAKQSFLVALDKRTGSEIWKVPRDEQQGWATPLVWQNDMRTEIVTASTRRVRSYGLDGKLLWELTGMTTLSTPSPFARDGLVYISSGYPGAAPRPVYAIRAGASGDITLKPGEAGSKDIAWYQPLLGTYNTSALAYGSYYYTLLDRGFLLCHDAKTGAQIYGRQRVSAESSGFTASPWAYNGKIFLLSEDGDTFVVQAGPEYKLLWKNSIDEMTLATPAVARGSVFIRTQSKLYRIAKEARR